MTQKIELRNLNSVDDRLQILNPGVQRIVVRCAVGQSSTTLVVADQGSPVRQEPPEVAPDHAVLVKLDVRGNRRDTHHRQARAVTGHGVRDPRPIVGGNESDALVHERNVQLRRRLVDLIARSASIPFQEHHSSPFT